MFDKPAHSTGSRGGGAIDPAAAILGLVLALLASVIIQGRGNRSARNGDTGRADG